MSTNMPGTGLEMCENFVWMVQPGDGSTNGRVPRAKYYSVCAHLANCTLVKQSVANDPVKTTLYFYVRQTIGTLSAWQLKSD